MKPTLILLLMFSQLLSAQKHIEPDKMKQFNVIINQEEQIVKTQILKDQKKVRLDDAATYVWYTANELVETKGGYDGKLLHGYYKAFFFSNQLKESGQIRYGLKNKKWRYWYSNGNLREIITWKKGRKNGAYAIYNDQGKLMAKGNFKNDLLHGKFYTYDPNGKITEKKKYKNGEEVVKIPKVRTRSQEQETRSQESGTRKQKARDRKQKAKENGTESQQPEQLQQDSTKKENFFQRIFKKKKKEPKTETPPTSATA